MDICGLSARVLVDSGAIHSFISIAFAEKLDRTPSSIDSWISILTTSSEVMESRCSLKACPIKIRSGFAC